MNKKIIRRKKVEELTGLPRASIYDQVKKKKFPSPISLGDNCKSVGWLECEVNAWIEERIAKSRGIHAPE